EEGPEKARSEGREGIDADFRLSEGAARTIGGSEQTAAFPAREQSTEQRYGAEHAVQGIGRHDGAGYVDRIAFGVHTAEEGDAERTSIGSPRLQLQTLAVEDERRFEPVEGDAFVPRREIGQPSEGSR